MDLQLWSRYHIYQLANGLQVYYLQVSLTSVRMSWAGLLGNARCANKIRIKYWKTFSPNDYKMSEKLLVETNSYLIKNIDKYIEYDFQVSTSIVTLMMMLIFQCR